LDNSPLLVRADNSRLLARRDLAAQGSAERRLPEHRQGQG
jgi:hypothetical protein